MTEKRKTRLNGNKIKLKKLDVGACAAKVYWVLRILDFFEPEFIYSAFLVFIGGSFYALRGRICSKQFRHYAVPTNSGYALANMFDHIGSEYQTRKKFCFCVLFCCKLHNSFNMVSDPVWNEIHTIHRLIVAAATSECHNGFTRKCKRKRL